MVEFQRLDAVLLPMPCDGAGQRVRGQFFQRICEARNFVFAAGRKAFACVSGNGLELRHETAWMQKMGGRILIERGDAKGLLAANPTQVQFFSQMMKLYPERLNPSILWMSAQALLPDE